jgi:hypothetical protein
MREVAKETAGKFDFPVVVKVQEHAGWFHEYFFDTDNPDGHLLFTANNSAPLSDKTKSILEQLKLKKIDFQLTLRR